MTQSTAPQFTQRFADYSWKDIQHSPLMLYYEVTQACDLVCKHCRASAQPSAHPEELSSDEARALIREASLFPKKPNIVFTGGDPLKRPDIFDLIAFAKECGLNVALTPSATPLATPSALKRAKDAGVTALGVSLDGADAATHDAFRGWQGSFDRTMEILAAGRDLGFYLQVNTTITKRNVGQVEAMAELLNDQGIHMWSVFFLVPVGRGAFEQRIAPEEYEQVFKILWEQAQTRPYAIKTTEAPHYRRFVLEELRHLPEEKVSPRAVQLAKRLTLGVGDGKGIMFVGHTGEIYPAGFLPIQCGRFPKDSIVKTYQEHEVFRALRNPNLLGGKCGVCRYRYVCGGSRARSYAVTGDYLAPEPDCVFFSDTEVPFQPH